MYFKSISYILLIFIALVFSSCGEESQIKEPSYTGTFVDAPVVGLSYSCSSSADIFQTDANGKFTCPVWENAKFQLNDLLLGTASSAQDVVTPYSLSPDDSLCAVNIARLLQTLDTHLEEGLLHLNKDLLEKVPSTIDCSSPSFAEDVEKALEMKLVTAKDAKKSMDSSIIDHGGDVPSTPTLAALEVSVDENASDGTSVGVVSIIDKGTTEITSIQLSGLGNENFSIFSTGEIKVAINAALDYETTTEYSLSALAINDAGSSNIATVQISIVDINESKPPQPEEKAPILESTNLSVQENSSPNTLVGHLPIIDTGSTPITNIVLTGDGNTNFLIDTDGNITVNQNAHLDFELQSFYLLQAFATNSVGTSNIVDLNISILDVNETILDVNETILPVLAASSGSIIENTSVGSYVGNITITSQGSSPITSFTLSGTGSDKFSIDASGDILVAAGASFDYETVPTYNLTSVANTVDGSSDSVNLTISISDYIDPFLIYKAQANPVLTNDYYGSAVDVSGNYIVVGTNNNNTTGFVYLYKRQSDNSVKEIAKIKPNSGLPSDRFGYSVSISGDYILVGAPDSNASRGIVYLFKRNSDTYDDVVQLATLTPDDGGNIYESFGYSVSIDNDYMVIGRPFSESTNSGAVDLFKRVSDTNIVELQKLVSSSSSYREVGRSVSINGNYIIIGAAYDTDSSNLDEGLAYVFKINSDTNTSQIARLIASDAVENDHFGNSIDINKEYIIIGSFFNNFQSGSTDSNGESIYLFKRFSDTNILEINKIQSPDYPNLYNFGKNVAMSGNYIVAGTSSPDSESAYIFQRTSDTSSGVTQIKKIQSNKPSSGAYFANSVAIDTNLIILGAYNEGDFNQGGAYLFDLEPQKKPYIYNPISQIIRYELFKKGTIYSFDAASPVLGAINYSSEGTDGSHFSFSSNNLSFLSTVTTDAAADYEVPVDANTDNNYSVTVIATDSSDATANTNLNIEIKDKEAFEVAAFSGDDSQNDDAFASAIATDGNFTIIGAPGEDTTASNSGAAYLYYKNPTDQSVVKIAKIKAPSANVNDAFGSAVAIQADHIVIGAPYNDTNGSAYVYKIDTGTVQFLAKIQGSASTGSDRFGSSVAIYNRLIAVGSPDTNDTSSGTTNSGYTYLYEINTPSGVDEILQIPSPDQVDYNNFGKSLAIDIDYLLVGSNLDINNQGHAYLFYIDTVSTPYADKRADINASDGVSADNFSQSLSLSGDYMVIGASGNDANGSAYIFKKDSNGVTTEIARIHPNDVVSYAKLGSAVSISGESGNNKVVAIGAPDDSNPSLYGGRVYLYNVNVQDDNVSRLDTLTPSDAAVDNNFGEAVSVSGDNLSVGMKFVDTQSSGATAKGTAYIFIKDPNQPVQ